MKLLLNSRVFRSLAFSNILNILGTTLFNFAFIVYINKVEHAEIWITVISVLNWVPIILGALTGDIADQTKHKIKAFSMIRWGQTIIYIIVALIIRQPTILFITTMLFLNFLSDFFGGIRSGIYNNLLKSNLENDEFQEAAGFSQSMNVLIDLIGGGIGLTLLAIVNNNFSIFAIFNAATFAASGLIVFWSRKHIREPKVEQKANHQTPSSSNFMKRILLGAQELQKLPGIKSVLSYLIVINGLAASTNILFVLSLRSHVVLWNFSFSEMFFLVTSTFSIAMFVSSLLTTDVFKRLNLSNLLFVHLSVQFVMSVAFLSGNGVMVLFGVAALGYTLAKLSPRFYGNLMRNLGNTQIGLVLGLINSVSLTLPVVTTAFFGIISSVVDIQISWGIYALLTIMLFIPLIILRKNINSFEK
ncbi:MFS transporter [Leuconostoc pseudomesenteroides]|uniref:MFS transporter n=1 Tax=Leuconostoc pseudomesenteroides TaxID=33968 RepID=UPI00111CAEED|nr:MFS transporter [Leuconostoc pseudomesenteroides]TOZ00925.1 hypothetical protein DIS14_11195 [Leuconostoc pseudomesenteroides]